MICTKQATKNKARQGSIVIGCPNGSLRGKSSKLKAIKGVLCEFEIIERTA